MLSHTHYYHLWVAWLGQQWVHPGTRWHWLCWTWERFLVALHRTHLCSAPISRTLLCKPNTTSQCAGIPDACRQLQRELFLPFHSVSILSLCLSSPLVPPTHCTSLTLTLHLHLLPQVVAGSLPSSPPSLFAFPAQVCVGTLLCSKLNTPPEERTEGVHTM